jgi:heme-degrading monooxygenase HmoA
MFSVVFQVCPKPERWDEYLGLARALRPELERIDGFVDNVRYRSLRHDGWILSLSGWRDEKALVRWRTQALHHAAQERGRDAVMLDYRLRVGQVTADTRLPAGLTLEEQRLDETQTGAATTLTLIDARHGGGSDETIDASEIGAPLGLDADADGLVEWDVFDAVLTPGDRILLLAWRDAASAIAFERALRLPAGARLRRVRVVRDYGMFDRREAPQYYP